MVGPAVFLSAAPALRECKTGSVVEQCQGGSRQRRPAVEGTRHAGSGAQAAAG
jgi:hypothetical protein